MHTYMHAYSMDPCRSWVLSSALAMQTGLLVDPPRFVVCPWAAWHLLIPQEPGFRSFGLSSIWHRLVAALVPGSQAFLSLPGNAASCQRSHWGVHTQYAQPLISLLAGTMDTWAALTCGPRFRCWQFHLHVLCFLLLLAPSSQWPLCLMAPSPATKTSHSTQFLQLVARGPLGSALRYTLAQTIQCPLTQENI